MIGRRAFLAGACTLATSPWVRAQPARKVFRIGILNFGDVPPAGAPPEPIVAALARLGYAEGRNVEYVRRYARGQRERFQALVAEILAQEPDLVYSAGSDIARTFKTAGPRVPVVFVVSDDPVASGVVAAMNRPGGMFTGVSMMSPELSGKRLELLAAALPALARVAMLYEPDHLAAYPAEMKAATSPAHSTRRAPPASTRSSSSRRASRWRTRRTWAGSRSSGGCPRFPRTTRLHVREA